MRGAKTITLPKRVQNRLEKIKSDPMVIETPAQAEEVAEYRKWAKDQLKVLEIRFTDPLEAAKQTLAHLRKLKKELASPLEWIIDRANGSLLAYKARLDREREAAREALPDLLEAEAEALDTDGLGQPFGLVEQAGEPVGVTVPLSSATFAEQWTYEVTDLVLLCDAVGRGVIGCDAVEPSRGFLWRHVQKHQDTVPIPGVRFFKVDKVVTR